MDEGTARSDIPGGSIVPSTVIGSAVQDAEIGNAEAIFPVPHHPPVKGLIGGLVQDQYILTTGNPLEKVAAVGSTGASGDKHLILDQA
jgi:hypothetical protein